MLVWLMVLTYVVFASSSVDGVVVAVVCFSINFAAYVAEMLRSGIDSVGIGQWEAAAAIGLGKTRMFSKIIMPQAVRFVLPVYKGEFINQMKATSVVGYIAIQDLTKASDLIRSRTYEALFPLIVTALIYFLMAWGFDAASEPDRNKDRSQTAQPQAQGHGDGARNGVRAVCHPAGGVRRRGRYPIRTPEKGLSQRHTPFRRERFCTPRPRSFPSSAPLARARARCCAA